MNYASLKTNIEDICETSFTDDQLAMFTQQAEEKLLQTVDIPALRKVDDGPVANTNKLYTLPSDYLYTYSIAIINNGTYTYLLNKDVNFLREAYPINTSAHYGIPKFYAEYSDTQIELVPTPNSNYELEHVYGAYPPSIVTASTSWLGDNVYQWREDNRWLLLVILPVLPRNLRCLTVQWTLALIPVRRLRLRCIPLVQR